MSSFGFSVLILVAGVALSLANSPRQAPVYYRPSNQQVRAPWPQPQPPPQSRPQSHSYYRQNPVAPPQARAPQPQPSISKYVNHTRSIIAFPSKQVVYRHNYQFDGNNVHEERSWFNDPVVSRAILSSYDPMNLMKPQPAPTLLPQSSPRNVEQHQNPRGIGSSELSDPIVTRPPPDPTEWSENIATLVNLIESNKLIKPSIGSHLQFKQAITGNNPDDDALIKSNLENSGLNFTNDENSCRPTMTRIKIGKMDNPEVIYYPATVEVKRCPLACFSWQFDCKPTGKDFKNVTIARYTIVNKKIFRDVQLFSIEVHTSCACECRSFAGCFSSLQFSPQRFTTR